MAALSVQARGRRGPGLHIGLLSGRVNTLEPALNKCHSQWGRSRPSPPARLRADNPSQKPCWSDSAVACGSGVGKVGGGEVLFRQRCRLQFKTRRFLVMSSLLQVYLKKLFLDQMFSVHTGISRSILRSFASTQAYQTV